MRRVFLWHLLLCGLALVLVWVFSPMGDAMACSCDHSKATLNNKVSSSGHHHAQVAQTKEKGSKKSEKAVDPVCKMALDSSKAVGKETYNKKTYFFCSKSCMDRFKAEPKKFIQS